MRCMKKIDENTVEELSIIKLISSEAFQEHEHPRDSDGKFTSKGGGGISIKDHMGKVDELKDDLYIKEILKSDGIPNEMELEKARLTKIVDDERKVDSDREFEYHSSDGNVYKMSGTQEFENSMKDLSEHNEKMKTQQKEYDKDYRESYGWKEGDPLRWTEYNDDDGDSAEYGYGANYTYKHLSSQDKDALMRNIWNSKTRNERQDKYQYLNSKHIPYVTEDGKTPEDLRDDLGEDNSIPSDYFFFTDKETNEQFSGKGMTEEEIKERARHGIGSATIQNADGSIENKVVYDRPLNYDKFNSKTIPATNFGEKGAKTDKLWDDLSGDSKYNIISEYTNYDGVLYYEWLDKERGDYYEWRKGQDGVLSEQEENHSKMYSEYDKSEETATTLNDEEKLEFAKTLWKQEYLDKHTDEELIDQIKGEYEKYGLEEKEQKLWQEKIPKTYFGMDFNERKEYVGNYFDSLPNHLKEDLIVDMDEVSYDDIPDEDGDGTNIKWSYLDNQQQKEIQETMEISQDDYDSSDMGVKDHSIGLEDYIRDMNPQKAIGFDYDKGIPSATSLDDLDKWADRMEKVAYSNTYKLHSKKAVIPTYPKVESRTVEEHEKQVEKINSELKDNTIQNSDGDLWTLRVLEKEHKEFDDYAKEQMKEGKINLDDLEFYKDIQTELYNNNEYWMFRPDNNKTEDDWKNMYFDHSLNGANANTVSSKARDLKLFKNLLDKNPQLEEKYSELIQKKTDELNHTNYDLFIKTPEFYRGTSTDELDHYMSKNNLGKLQDWGEKNYPFTSLTVDKKSAQSPSEQRTKWEVNGNEITGGKVVITYEGDSVRELGLPVQYNVKGNVNNSGMDASEMNGTPYPIKLYSEREVRINQGERIPKIKEINFGVNIDKYKGDKITKEQMINLRNKYKLLVGNDSSRVKFYGFKTSFDTGESYLGESYTVEAFVEQDHPRDEDGKFTDKDGGVPKQHKSFIDPDGDPLEHGLGSMMTSDQLKSSSIKNIDNMKHHQDEIKRIITWMVDEPQYIEGTGMSGYEIKHAMTETLDPHKIAFDLDSDFQHSPDELKQMWIKLSEENQEIGDRFVELERNVIRGNETTKQLFEKSPSFFRGTDVHELDDMLEDGIIGSDKFRHEDYDHNDYPEYDQPRTYDFTAVTPHKKITKYYGDGVMIEFDGDSVRKHGTPMTYDYFWRDFGATTETEKGGMHPKYMDHHEVRMPREIPLSDIKIKKIYLTEEYWDNSSLNGTVEDYAEKLSKYAEVEIINDQS